MFIQGSEIEKSSRNSMEYKASVIGEAIVKHFDSPVEVLATYDDYAYVFDDSNIWKVKYRVEDDEIHDLSSELTEDIKTIDEDDTPSFVADTLRQLVEHVLSGEEPSRTQVREVAQLINGDEYYWVSDVINKIEENSNDSKWFNMYEANQEKIRTAVYGRIRAVESKFPKTKFSKIPTDKLIVLKEELKESINIIIRETTDMVDECKKLVFNEKQGDFFTNVGSSLIVEAQALVSLLSKVDKLMLQPSDFGRVAEANDNLVERVKTMAVVTEYLKKKSNSRKEETNA